MRLVTRKLTPNLLFALKSSPIVFLNGPRQAGKSTLVTKLAKNQYPAEYISLDHLSQLEAAQNSPESFLNQSSKPLIIDEVQLAPELFRNLKIIVDERRLSKKASYGRYLLTGSTNILALPKLSDALVGRMIVKSLYPLAALEIHKGKGSFLDDLFCANFNEVKKTQPLNSTIFKATYPEIFNKEKEQRAEWFESYLSTIIQRDVKSISEISKTGHLLRMLRILATRSGNLINDADIARSVGLNPVTNNHYRNVLKAMFLTFDVPPWYRNIGKRLVKTPKGYLIDSSFLCHLLGWDLDELKKNRPDFFGHVAENFVATELLKLLSFSNQKAQLFHFRTSDNKEVDFVLERNDGKICGIEVKASDHVTLKDFKNLQILQEACKNDFSCGVILYDGSKIIAFDKKLFALPISSLWN